MNLAIAGATGRTGRATVAAAHAHEDATVAWGLAGDPDGESVDGVRVYAAGELESLLDRQRPNVLIDFTVPDASIEIVQAAADAAVPVVVGTTGFSDDQLARLRAASESVPVLRASNFARGVQALLRTLEEALSTLPGYDVEVTETHHGGKRDAPSGTANTILDHIDEIRGEDAARVHGRVGDQPRTGEEIGVHARRAGAVRGEHEVLIAGNDESLSITHRAGSRRVYGAGAVDAAIWLAGRPPGWYTFGDVIEDER